MGRRQRNDGCDALCRSFQRGDKICARMTARVSDCVRIVGDHFDGISKFKKAFLDHLEKLAVLNGTEAVLCEQTLTVVEVDSP